MINIFKELITGVLRKIGYEIRKLPSVTALSVEQDSRSVWLGFLDMAGILERIEGDQDRTGFGQAFSLERNDMGICFYFKRSEDNIRTIEEIMAKNKIETLIRNDRKILPQTRDIAYDRIHYGSGSKFIKGWLNVDLFESNDPSYMRVNLIDSHPFRDDSFEFAFSEDVLEHFDQEYSLIFLSEAFRTLRANGILRLSFPGLEGVLRMHYTPWHDTTAYTGKIDAYLTWEHRHFYTFEEIRMVAKAIGFRNVKNVECGLSEHKELAGLDTRINQKDLNCHVELQK